MRKQQSLLQNSQGLILSYETFLDFIRKLKRFRSEGSFRESRKTTFLGFVDLLYHFFRQFNSFRIILRGLAEKTSFCLLKKSEYTLKLVSVAVRQAVYTITLPKVIRSY